MNKNLKILDMIDKEKNIYELIVELSKRTHELISGAIANVELKSKNTSPVLIAMEEYFIKERIKNE